MQHQFEDQVRFWQLQHLLDTHRGRLVVEQPDAHGYGEISIELDENVKVPTHALSVLLNLARLISMRALPAFAWLRTSDPMCSPSRSQSVQMNSALEYLAWLRMFSAIGCLSY